MIRQLVVVGLLLAGAVFAHEAAAREWTDATGVFSLDAELVDFDGDHVMLQRPTGELVSLPIKGLSKADQEFLASKDASESMAKMNAQEQTWTLKDGTKLVGKVVDYGRKEVTIERRRGKIYVNDKLFDNLPELYRALVPKVVAHYEKTEIGNEKAFRDWVLKQRGVPKTFTVDGMMIELAGGDEYGVPFFLFTDDDLKVLEPGWKAWMAAKEDEAQQDMLAFHLENEAEAYQRDREMQQQATQMQLTLLAVQAGLTDIWEVQLFPKPGTPSGPLAVVVPARNSAQAINAALKANPAFVAGPARKLNRRGR